MNKLSMTEINLINSGNRLLEISKDISILEKEQEKEERRYIELFKFLMHEQEARRTALGWK